MNAALRTWFVILATLSLLITGCGGENEELTLTRGMSIRKSAFVREGTYFIPGIDSTASAVLTILGRDLVIDFQGAVLQGANSNEEKGGYSGVAIFVDQASHVTLKNLTIRGYKTGLACKSCEDLVLENVILADNLLPQENLSIP
ncbi:MAG: hypothetical protein NWR72_18125 [Bacteroidia bacterium]|nr:hypothetical protein [Bacteroidia bacterium]